MAFEKLKTDNWEYNDQYLSEVFHKIVDAGAVRLDKKRNWMGFYHRKDEEIAKIKRDVRNLLVSQGHSKPTVLQIDAACIGYEPWEEFQKKMTVLEYEYDLADKHFWDLKLEWDTCSQIMKERGSERVKSSDLW